MKAGTGLGVVDPHGELVDELLGKIPEERADDVILFDPLDKERPLGFNLIEWRAPEERDLIIVSFDFEKIMNEGKILLVKLEKGRYGSSVNALLANQIVARFKIAAMKRGETRPRDRRDFYLYIDECHNLPQENFMEQLAEARKYRMG